MNHILLIMACILLLVRCSAAVNITHCDARVPPGETGELQNDLVCDSAGHAVTLFDDATLNLNGHSITGTFLPWPHDERLPGSVIECDRDCTITGPGEIHDAIGPGLLPVFGDNATAIRFGTGNIRASVTIQDVTVHHCGYVMQGVTVAPGYPRARIVATNLTFTDNTGVAIAGAAILDATNVTADRNLGGISATRLLRETNLHVSDNTYGGVSADRVVINGLVANGNTSVGVSGRIVRLTNATVTGNTFLGIAEDIFSKTRPRLATSTCTKSQRPHKVIGAAGWGVCTFD